MALWRHGLYGGFRLVLLVYLIAQADPQLDPTMLSFRSAIRPSNGSPNGVYRGSDGIIIMRTWNFMPSFMQEVCLVVRPAHSAKLPRRNTKSLRHRRKE